MPRIDVVTLFPELFTSWLAAGVVGQAQRQGAFRVEFHSPRDFALNRYGSVDDRPYGGGEGMLMSAIPLAGVIDKIRNQTSGQPWVVALTPRGQSLNQEVVQELAKKQNLVLVCGRYEGIDERWSSLYVDQEISIGDFVLSGGELPAMLLMDSVARLYPGVLGNSESSLKESFSEGLLEQPQFTRPADFKGLPVPRVLLSGDHAKIKKFNQDLALLITWARRPELLIEAGQDPRTALSTYREMTTEERRACGLPLDEAQLPSEGLTR